MSAVPAVQEDLPQFARFTRHRVWALGVGVCALGACVVGLRADPSMTLASYLAAWLYFLGLSLGALAALMVHHLTGGDWGRPVRRYFEAMLMPVPILAVLFVPLAYGLPSWLGEASHGYLSRGAFIARALLFFALWLLFAWALTRAGREQKRAVGLSAGGLIVYLVTATLAATDWIASLTPHWASTNLGLIVVTGQGLGALAFAVAAAAARVTPEQGNDLGNLLLTFVMTWMYLAFVQLLIIWAEDLPRETVWYMPRLKGGGQYFALTVMVTQFAVPFVLLLFRRFKRDTRALCAMALWLLVAHLLDVIWLVLPSVAGPETTLAGAAWRVILATIGVGGVWLFFVARGVEVRSHG